MPKIGVKLTRHSKYVTFQWAEVGQVDWQLGEAAPASRKNLPSSP